jgi:protein SCO1/2
LIDMPKLIDTPTQINRRGLLRLAGACGLACGVPAAAAAAPTGWVQPRLPAPPLRITMADGRSSALASAVANKVTAVQLMFTGCSSTCPPQGALFAAVAQSLTRADVQLLSVSIDALGDTPSKVASWQARFGHHSAWRTAVADVKDVDRLGDFMKGHAGKAGTHTSQVFVFDRQGRLSYRTGDSPSAREVHELLTHIAQSG